MQLRLEHLEQGFSVYVNGANSELRTSPRKAIHPDFSRSASHAEGTHGEHRPSQATRWLCHLITTAGPHPTLISLPASN